MCKGRSVQNVLRKALAKMMYFQTSFDRGCLQQMYFVL